MQEAGSTKKETTINQEADRLTGLAFELETMVNGRCRRNPDEPTKESGVELQRDNVLDEIIGKLEFAQEKLIVTMKVIQTGIFDKLG